MKAQPLRNERMPLHLAPRVPPGTNHIKHKVADKETWITVARAFNVRSPGYLIYYNFNTFLDAHHPHQEDTYEVNWYLREYVGCNVSTDGGLNWAFSNSADPGYIYIPPRMMDFEGDGLVVAGSTGIGNAPISVPQYDDHNFLDTLSEIFDTYSVADMGINMSEIELPAVVEGGMIVVGPIVGAAAPFVVIGVPYADTLKGRTRDHFFEGFSIGLVMTANGAKYQFIIDFPGAWLQYDPHDSQFPEKAHTFKKLHNAGLLFGIKQGKKLNSVDQKDLFVFLHSQLSEKDRQYFSPKIPWAEWTPMKRKQYYDRMSSIIKQKMLQNNLQFKFK